MVAAGATLAPEGERARRETVIAQHFALPTSVPRASNCHALRTCATPQRQISRPQILGIVKRSSGPGGNTCRSDRGAGARPLLPLGFAGFQLVTASMPPIQRPCHLVTRLCLTRLLAHGAPQHHRTDIVTCFSSPPTAKDRELSALGACHDRACTADLSMAMYHVHHTTLHGPQAVTSLRFRQDVNVHWG